MAWIQTDAGVISRTVSVLRHRKGSRASQYFALIALRTRGKSSLGRTRIVARNSGPVTFPRMVQGAIVAFGLLRMRLHFPVLLLVMKQSRPLSSANQIGVRTATPFLRKVARLI